MDEYEKASKKVEWEASFIVQLMDFLGIAGKEFFQEIIDKYGHLNVVLPGDGVPSIHRSCDRGHSLLTATRTFTVHVAVPPSAYPPAFPKALASEAILPLVKLAADYLLRLHT